MGKPVKPTISLGRRSAAKKGALPATNGKGSLPEAIQTISPEHMTISPSVFYLFATAAGHSNISLASGFYKVEGKAVASGLCSKFGYMNGQTFRYVAAESIPAQEGASGQRAAAQVAHDRASVSMDPKLKNTVFLTGFSRARARREAYLCDYFFKLKNDLQPCLK